MALDMGFPDTFPTYGQVDPWHLSVISGFQNNAGSVFKDTSIIGDRNGLVSHTPSPILSEIQLPQYVQPQELQTSSSPTESSGSPPYRNASLDPLPNFTTLERQQAIRRLSMASNEANNDAYRPRNTPARRRKASTSRITPRSDKHARELELNRKAATKCRNRQKTFVDNLQKRCRGEEEKMHLQTSLVHALHDEVVALRNEIMRQSFCGCQSLRNTMPTAFGV